MSGLLESIVESLALLHSKVDLQTKLLPLNLQGGAVPIAEATAPSTARKPRKTKPAADAVIVEIAVAELTATRDELYTKLREASQEFGIPRVKELYKPFGNPASFAALETKYYPDLLEAVNGLFIGQASLDAAAQEGML